MARRQISGRKRWVGITATLAILLVLAVLGIAWYWYAEGRGTGDEAQVSRDENRDSSHPPPAPESGLLLMTRSLKWRRSNIQKLLPPRQEDWPTEVFSHRAQVQVDRVLK